MTNEIKINKESYYNIIVTDNLLARKYIMKNKIDILIEMNCMFIVNILPSKIDKLKLDKPEWFINANTNEPTFQIEKFNQNKPNFKNPGLSKMTPTG